MIYKLYLTEDTRSDINYHYFIGYVWNYREFYFKKLKLWDPLSRSWLKQEVVLVVTSKVVEQSILKVKVVEF